MSPSTLTSSIGPTCVSFTRLTTLGTIGKGSYGLITRVQDEDSGRVLVMKTMPRSTLWFDGESLAMHELEAMHVIGKDWYPTILGAFVTEQDVMLVMPYYARGDIRSFIKSTSDGCVSQELARFWSAELILAIHGIHKAGLIHRDIKPENIFIDDARHIVLADFGVAHLFPDFPHSTETDLPLLFVTPSNPYRTSGVCGTPIYLPPEVCSGEEYSFGMDYYSMGMVVHELITGTVPIDSASKRARESRGPFVINLRPNAYAPQDLDEPGREFLTWVCDHCFLRFVCANVHIIDSSPHAIRPPNGIRDESTSVL
ncbi:kinase-like domain-containing protein [Crucibulum laeve]|uniref:non-specific serine/threonine protein kinase n=1 Tax=Crucibulum laeve TaxID=68775 RepID=A0A5C3M0P4_9AGAR|nr:kinase-like domain-containing protein [Crucibulum laeve]